MVDSKTPLMGIQGQLIFTKDGQWMHEGELVTHTGISDYFSNHLSFRPDLQSYVLSDGIRALKVEVEDTPVVVRTILNSHAESGIESWQVALSGGNTERFAAETLSVSAGGTWYCRVRNGEVKARLLSPAIQHLTGFIEEAEGKYFLKVGGQTFAIEHEKH